MSTDDTGNYYMIKVRKLFVQRIQLIFTFIELHAHIINCL